MCISFRVQPRQTQVQDLLEETAGKNFKAKQGGEGSFASVLNKEQNKELCQSLH